jgi:DNA-binding CsgD family transcriptional regulator
LGNARRTQSAQVALDASGRFLLAVDRNGRIQWCTPQAGRLLATALNAGAVPEGDEIVELAGLELPASARQWLQLCLSGERSEAPVYELPADNPAAPLQLSYVAHISGTEILLRLSDKHITRGAEALQQRFQLTAREAEVLLWITNGKSNREIAEILSLSPRTVNKHLEQIYAKLGVENRTAATSVAMRSLSQL